MGPLQLLFGLINFLLCLGGVVLVAISSWLLIEPVSFTKFLDVTINQINGDNATVPEELTEFIGQVNNALWLSLVGGKWTTLAINQFLKSDHSFARWFPRLLWSLQKERLYAKFICCHHGCFNSMQVFESDLKLTQLQNVVIQFVFCFYKLWLNNESKIKLNECAIQSYKVQIASAVVVFWYSSDVTNVVVVMLKQYNPDASSVSSSINQFIDITQESKTKK